jgi:hypothetical protein
MTPEQKRVMRKLSPPTGRRGTLLEALKRKFKSPKECLLALGLDERLLDTSNMAFDQGAPRFSKARAVSWLLDKGCSMEECDEFLQHLDGGGAEGGDGGSRDRPDHATYAQNDAIERALHKGPRERAAAGDMPGLSQSQSSSPMEIDEMPDYGANGLPRPATRRYAMDGVSPRTAATRIAPGLDRIRIGVI